MRDFEVVVVGAGPAGLSAALILGRCRRRVLVLDTDQPRNAASRELHGFLSRDGIPPQTLRRIGREQLARYDTVTLVDQAATAVRRTANGFQVRVAGGQTMSCRKLLIATGVVDELPPIDGIDAFYGKSVFHCPYCDGWESRDQPLAVYSRSANGVGLAVEMRLWSGDIVLCTDGMRLDAAGRARLARHHIPWRAEPIVRLEGRNGRLRRIVFATGDALDRRGMFFNTGQHQATDLAKRLGCNFTRKGSVRTGKYEASDIPGLYVAGDASRLVQLAIVAASEGAQAAFAINTDLMREDEVRSARSTVVAAKRRPRA